jgi:crotonobetainyl-CoA:carnitine CoA-transferase CaiB-like acyl-CoA transferase
VTASASRPLEGLRILDLTRLLPGPLATRHLLELGAEIVKIEGPAGLGQDDGTRTMWQTPAEAASGAPGLFFRELNDGKRLLRIDLREAAGRARLIDLVRDADALIEGFRPGVMARLGLGYEALREVNPRLVMCAVSGYGQSGPWSQRAGHDINYIAMAGVLEQIAGRDGNPGLPNFQIADLLGGTQAAVNGILAGLLGAVRTGQGSFVDVSMTHEVWRHAVIARTALVALGKVAPPGRDLLSGGVPCYGVYRTRDGRHLALGALEPKFWQGVCEVVGRPQWAKRHHAWGLEVGGAEALALRAELASIIAGRTLSEWQPAFDAADCCVTPVLRLDEARAHPLFAR